MPTPSPEAVEALKALLTETLDREEAQRARLLALEGEVAYLTEALALVLPGFIAALGHMDAERLPTFVSQAFGGRVPILFLPYKGQESDAILAFCQPILRKITPDDCTAAMERATKGTAWTQVQL